MTDYTISTREYLGIIAKGVLGFLDKKVVSLPGLGRIIDQTFIRRVIKLRGHHIKDLTEYIILRDKGIDHCAIADGWGKYDDTHGKGIGGFEAELCRRIYEDDSDLRVRVIASFDDVCTFPCKTFIRGINNKIEWYFCIGPQVLELDLNEAPEYQLKVGLLYPTRELIDKIRSSSRFKQEEKEVLEDII